MPLIHTVEQIILKNGARGLLIDAPGTTAVSYEFSFRAGNDYAARPDIQQTAHLLEHMAFGPNERFDSAESSSQEFCRNGAYSNAMTFPAELSYYGDSALMELDRILDLWQLALTRPVFTQEVLDAEKKNAREELVDQENAHSRVLYQATERAMGSTDFLDKEKIATIDAVTLNDVREHYTRTHTLKNLCFIIAGNIHDQKDMIIQKMESWSLPTGNLLPIKYERMHSAGPVRIVRQDVHNVNFRFVMGMNRRLDNEEVNAMSMLGHLLTGTFHSRVYGKARSRGICYDVNSSYSYGASASDWEFYGQVQKDNAVPLYQLIREQTEKVAAGDLTQQEVDEAKQYALGTLEMRGETVSSLAGMYSSYLFHNEPLQLLIDAPGRIKKINLATITRLAKEFIDTNIWGYGALGDLTNDELLEYNSEFAKIFEKR